MKQQNEASIKKPDGEEWLKIVDAAAAVFLGAPYKDVAEKLEMSERHFRRVRKQTWWDEALELAQTDSLAGLVAKARGVVDDTLSNGTQREAAQMARWILERQDIQFATREERTKHQARSAADELLDEFTEEELREFLESRRSKTTGQKTTKEALPDPFGEVEFAWEQMPNGDAAQ